MKKTISLAIIAGCLLTGCATATVPCIQGQTTTANVGGQDLSTILTAFGSIVQIVGPLMAASAAKEMPQGTKLGQPSASASPSANGSVTVKTSTLLGAMTASCSNTTNPPPVTPQ